MYITLKPKELLLVIAVIRDGVLSEMECYQRWSVIRDGVLLEMECYQRWSVIRDGVFQDCSLCMELMNTCVARFFKLEKAYFYRCM